MILFFPKFTFARRVGTKLWTKYISQNRICDLVSPKILITSPCRSLTTKPTVPIDLQGLRLVYVTAHDIHSDLLNKLDEPSVDSRSPLSQVGNWIFLFVHCCGFVVRQKHQADFKKKTYSDWLGKTNAGLAVLLPSECDADLVIFGCSARTSTPLHYHTSKKTVPSQTISSSLFSFNGVLDRICFKNNIFCGIKWTDGIDTMNPYTRQETWVRGVILRRKLHWLCSWHNPRTNRCLQYLDKSTLSL